MCCSLIYCFNWWYKSVLLHRLLLTYCLSTKIKKKTNVSRREITFTSGFHLAPSQATLVDPMACQIRSLINQNWLKRPDYRSCKKLNNFVVKFVMFYFSRKVFNCTPIKQVTKYHTYQHDMS